jgi:CMP/dCMP kinase
LLEGRDVTERIRDDDITAMSSIVSTISGVRRAMVVRQREMAKRGGVLNGRDIGTVVFPDADIKFFLDAAAEERAERRFMEDQLVNPDTTLEQTLAEINERDRRDTNRVDSPLKIADDAIVIDSTGLSIQAVFERMMDHVHRNH